MNVHTAHSLLAHLPFGLALAGPVVIALALRARGEGRTLRLAAFWVYAMLAASLFALMISGGLAWVDLSSRAREGVAVLMEKHTTLAWFTLLWTMVTLGLLGVAVARPRLLGEFGLAGAMLSGLLAALAIMVSAGAGTRLVFDHAIGVAPPPRSETRNRQAEAETVLTPLRPLQIGSGAAPDFERDIRPLFGGYATGFGPDDVAAMATAGDGWIVPGRPGQSRLVRVLRGEEPPGPAPGGQPMPEEALHMVRQWILSGAQAYLPTE
jgi:hypothetical protein